MSRTPDATSRVAALALAIALSGWAASAAAQCTYTALSSSVPVTAGNYLQYFSFNQTALAWAGVAVRPTPGEDWDVGLYSTTAPYPDCVSTLLVKSEEYGSHVDFVVGDFNHNLTKSYRVAALRWAGTGSGLVEWDDDSDELTVGAARVQATLGPTDVIEVYDVNLTAGVPYSFHFSAAAAANIHYFVFENSGGGVYWANRAAAVIASDHCEPYTPTVSGYHGVAVVCDSGTGTYKLGITSGECGCPTELASGVVAEATNPVNNFSYAQTTNYWSAVALRFDPTLFSCALLAYAEPYGAAAPDCLSGLLIQDWWSSGPIKVLAADFNSNTPQTCFVQALCDISAKAEWAEGSEILYVNGPQVERSTGPNDVVEVWDAYLYPGHTYNFSINPAAARNFMELRVYGPSPGTLYSNNLLVQTTGVGTYTATTSGFYGVVAINRTGQEGTYFVHAYECVNTALTSNLPREIGSRGERFSINQSADFWAAVGVRDFEEDFEMEVFSTASLGPDCLTGRLAGSFRSPPEVDYVVGDFNHTAKGTYYPMVTGLGDFRPGATWVEWDDGPDYVPVDAGSVHRDWGANDVLDCWDAPLEAGKSYDIELIATGMSARVDLFRSQGGSFWGSVDDKVRSISAGARYTYTAPADDLYGLVVVHLDASPGSYDLRVAQPGVAVEGEPRLVTGLTAIEPNPTRGPVRAEYALRERGRVAFYVVDMAGREVWRRAPETREAGRWSLEWGGMDTAGRRLAPGIYFLRMMVDDRPVALRKVTLLR